ncbi:sulfite exporter TauE/SafE family protein [Ramlibacter sp.]|uniref:sulfite exporter TauE/SafE family protein n=1 Tax=Ramlibacter sp. TaxID=1917967 RepID=UPI002CF095B3|nr:sulfite exporter TauE/SafE family protein [Ramlibacter sp.]HWI82032.1 sulfite exporter TauE/SafE family protein [Ramlibacter sp.]
MGVLVGLVLALTGAGGAIIAVPLLVFGLHLTLAEAAPVGLLAVALAASTGAMLGLRSRVLRYRAAGLMALAGGVASPIGLWVAQRVPNAPLTAVFAMVLTIVAVRMLRQAWLEQHGAVPAAAHAPPCRLDPAAGRLRWNTPCAAALAVAGAAAGFLSGLLGVGGGFILVPSLLAASDLPMKAIIATSMGVLALVSAVGVVGASIAGHMQWQVGWPFAGGALAGLLLGRRFAGRLAGPRLQQGFALLALGIAAGLLVKIAR